MRAKPPRQLLSGRSLAARSNNYTPIGGIGTGTPIARRAVCSSCWTDGTSFHSYHTAPATRPRAAAYIAAAAAAQQQQQQQGNSHHVAQIRRASSSWATALQSASDIVADAASFTVSPTQLVAEEMKSLTSNIQALLSSGHPSLDKVAKYYVKSEGKHLRPLVVLLMARATSVAAKSPTLRADRDGPLTTLVNTPLSPPSVLQDINPSEKFGSAGTGICSDGLSITSSQRRLAEITEMIHAASLLHDDVIDNAETRRGSPSGNLEFGNKMAILGGDFLLGRASVALARLRDAEVIELLATVIANLVEGEFMQLNNSADHNSGRFTKDTFDYYLQKTYLKSASLISKSCRATALLGGCAHDVVDAAYAYGKNLGLSFQLIDDMLDYTVSESELGKPAQADLKLGLATAPVLFAWKEFEDLGPLVERKFSQPGDVEKAYDYVQRSDGLARTRQLAENFSTLAIEAISVLPDSDAKEGLVQLCLKGLSRRK